MPRVIFKFERANRGELPREYRVVDRTPGGVVAGGVPQTNATIEVLSGYDAMQNPLWMPAGEEGVTALLNEIIYYTVTQTPPQGAVDAPPPPPVQQA